MLLSNRNSRLLQDLFHTSRATNAEKKGHYAPTCPNAQRTPNGSPNRGDHTPNSPAYSSRRKKPGPGEPSTRPRNPPVKDSNGQPMNEYYCNICRIWNKNHLTDQHKTKYTGADSSTSTAASAATAAAATSPPASAIPEAVGASATITPRITMAGGVATHTAAANLTRLLGQTPKKLPTKHVTIY